MILGIMQPYFFPNLGYFSLIKQVDRFLLLDDVQYRRHGWVNRNRILHPASGWQYIQVPVRKHHRATPIRDVVIASEVPWRDRLLGQIRHYRRKAPYFVVVEGLLEQALSGPKGPGDESLAQLNALTIKATCKYLGISSSVQNARDLKLSIPPPRAPDEWALRICEAIPEVTEYWNPPGGRAFFKSEKYRASGIALRFIELPAVPYPQGRSGFEPNLSVLDAMMFLPPEEIRNRLDQYELSAT